MNDSTKIKDTFLGSHGLAGGTGGPGANTASPRPGTPDFENQNALGDSNIKYVYSFTNSAGEKIYYGSYDNSNNLASFRPLGFSLILLIFSIYLFHISTKIYRQYFDKTTKGNPFNPIFFGCALFFNISWIAIVMSIKGLPLDLLPFEFLNFPNQFVLGVMLSSLLLLSIGIFRFVLVASSPNSSEDEKKLKDRRLSLVGFIFGLLSALANVVTIWGGIR